MNSPSNTKPWDLSHVLELVNTLSTPGRTLNENEAPTTSASHPVHGDSEVTTDLMKDVETKDFAHLPAVLGDFGKIWQFLGTPRQSPKPALPSSAGERAPESSLPSKDDYASDGAVRYRPHSKENRNVTWLDQTSADEPIPGSNSDHSSPETASEPKLTKSQRKKRNRRERKAQETALTAKVGAVSESEADSVWRQTPARKASSHVVMSEATQRNHSIARDALRPAVAVTPDRLYTSKQHSESLPPLLNERPKEPGTKPLNPGTSSPLPKHQRSDTSQLATTTPVRQVPMTQHSTDERHVSKSSLGVTNSNATLLPSSVEPKIRRAAPSSQRQGFFSDEAARAVEAVKRSQRHLTNITKPVMTIEPKTVRSGEDRHWALLLKLISDYSEDRKYLVAPMNMTTHNNNPEGIHIFVDASNIFIGFNDQLKRSRNIPLSLHVPPVHLSFDALALLLERRRPVAKRVLAGSTPHLPAFEKARAVGYECSILEKVFKARELTDRQIYFRDIDQRRGSARAKASTAGHGTVARSTNPRMLGHGNDSGSGSCSGSETTAHGPQYAPAKMIEQGVDEILHLKILESIVDAESPSTMVIATGDAAQAEYSEGFMAMAQRALKKGWKVELVSWSRNISSMYMRKQFRDAWGTNFRIVFLDDYAEELLDM